MKISQATEEALLRAEHLEEGGEHRLIPNNGLYEEIFYTRALRTPVAGVTSEYGIYKEGTGLVTRVITEMPFGAGDTAEDICNLFNDLYNAPDQNQLRLTHFLALLERIYYLERTLELVQGHFKQLGSPIPDIEKVLRATWEKRDA